MAGQSSRTKQISMRVPVKELATVDTYAAAHDLSRAQAVLHFLRLGIAAEAGASPATKADLVAAVASLQRSIADQPIRVELPPAPEPEERRGLLSRLLGRRE